MRLERSTRMTTTTDQRRRRLPPCRSSRGRPSPNAWISRRSVPRYLSRNNSRRCPRHRNQPRSHHRQARHGASRGVRPMRLARYRSSRRSDMLPPTTDSQAWRRRTANEPGCRPSRRTQVRTQVRTQARTQARTWARPRLRTRLRTRRRVIHQRMIHRSARTRCVSRRPSCSCIQGALRHRRRHRREHRSHTMD